MSDSAARPRQGSAMNYIAQFVTNSTFQGMEILVATISTVAGAAIAWIALPRIKKDVRGVTRLVADIFVLDTRSPGWRSDGVGRWKKLYPGGFMAVLRFLPAIGNSATLSIAQRAAADALWLQEAGTRVLEVYRPNEAEPTWEEMLTGGPDHDHGREADAMVEAKLRV
jgi:hypothetical protein